MESETENIRLSEEERAEVGGKTVGAVLLGLTGVLVELLASSVPAPNQGVCANAKLAYFYSHPRVKALV